MVAPPPHHQSHLSQQCLKGLLEAVAFVEVVEAVDVFETDGLVKAVQVVESLEVVEFVEAVDLFENVDKDVAEIDGLVEAPVLYTVGQQATFWNMNSSVWAIWAVLAVREKKWI